MEAPVFLSHFNDNEDDEVILNAPFDHQLQFPTNFHKSAEEELTYMSNFPLTATNLNHAQFNNRSWNATSPMASPGSEVQLNASVDGFDASLVGNHSPNDLTCTPIGGNNESHDEDTHFRVDDEILLNMPPFVLQEMEGKFFHLDEEDVLHHKNEEHKIFPDHSSHHLDHPHMSPNYHENSYVGHDLASNSSVHEPKQPLSSPNESPSNQAYDFVEIRGKFIVEEKIGEGTFSSVYRAVSIDGREIVALKRVYPTCSPIRILNEMLHLKMLGGTAHVPRILGGLRYRDQVTIVLPYFPHDKFKEILPLMNLIQIKSYMRALFESLRHLHTHGIIHRDVKPGNFLYNCKTNHFMLVDFGLAQHERENQGRDNTEEIAVIDSNYSPNQNNNVQVQKRRRSGEVPENLARKKQKVTNVTDPLFNMLTKTSSGIDLKAFVHKTAELTKSKTSFSPRLNRVCCAPPRAGTRGFRAPEVLLKSFEQTVAVDIWSAGVIFLCILSTRYPFFQSPNDLTSLVEISSIFGTKEIKELASQLNRKVFFPFDIPKQPLRELVQKLSKPRNFSVPESAYDLLEKCLDLNPKARISADAALKHPFFNENG